MILEGLDEAGKSTLIEHLTSLLKERASFYRIADSLSFNDESHFLNTNIDLTEQIVADDHEVILLNGSWLSGEAASYASGKNDIQNWPDPLYFPTHLFLLRLPEEKRLESISGKEGTNLSLNYDENYRKRYSEACQLMMKKLKWNTICLELDSDFFSFHEMARKIISLLDVDHSILDPRKLTKSDKRQVQPFYLSWEAHLMPPTIDSEEFIQIIPNANNCPIEKQRGCQFANIDKPFEYTCFSEQRDLPVSIGFLEDKAIFDQPFTDRVWQIQDLPIAFPTDSIEEYEYRLPKCLHAFEELVQKTADTWQKLSLHPQKYYAYLTVSHDIVPPFKSQRRPCIHCDGFKSARIQSEELGQYAFVATNAIPTIYYIESFNVDDLDPAKDDFFVAFSQRTLKEPIECQFPYEIMMMDPYTLHAARPNLTAFPVRRTFVRILFSTRMFDRIGNTHNPAFDYAWKMVPRDMQAQFICPKKD